jgi:DNA-binding GntR family transcriptional regulator
LEAICAKLAARRVNEESAGLLRGAMRACEAACKKADMAAYREANQAFHEAIYKCSRNDALAEHVLSIRQRTRRFRIGDLNTPAQIAKSLAEHQDILNAILDGDEKAALDAMVHHVPIGNVGFSEFLSSLPADFFES